MCLPGRIMIGDEDAHIRIGTCARARENLHKIAPRRYGAKVNIYIFARD